LTPKRTPQWHGVPVSVREVQPKDAWRDQSSLAGATHVASPLVEFESRLPATERAQVFYFDLPHFSHSANAVIPVLSWATHYRRFLPSDEGPASLVAIGKGLQPKKRRLLRDTEVNFLDESHQSVQPLMGGGSRLAQIFRLMQNLRGVPIPRTSIRSTRLPSRRHWRRSRKKRKLFALGEKSAAHV